MLGLVKNILKISTVAVVAPGIVLGAQQANPRSAVNNARNVTRSADSESNASIRRSATSVIARSAKTERKQAHPVVTARPAAVRSATVRSARPAVKGANVARATSKSSVVRSGTKAKTGGVNVSRAGTARATAVFNDVSKIGGGYSACRDSYATCMDQICANANDTYRRCFCSDRFSDFRDTSDKLDEALKLLAEFQNVNLDAINKTAAEVDAMYSATEGEAAIKRDTSASQKLLNSISEILTTKRKKTASSYTKRDSYSTSSLGVLDLSSFSTVSSDPFSDSSSTFSSGGLASAFSSGRSTAYEDLSSLEGGDLYNAAMNQCAQVTRESCGGDAMFNLARSSYSVLISQDCNAYEKNITAKKTSVEDTVRKAEKYLREARLEEYRSHNSADVSECLSNVESALRQTNACGPEYERCLDYSGLYINPLTGDPVYSQALFGLNNLIKLDGSADVLRANSDFNKFLEEKKIFAQGALDSCRGISDTVWTEYKRMALIQIAQAQDDKIEQVKASCVDTIKECYDTQTGSMNSLAEDVSSSSTKAISAIAARDACKDKVFACAALYGDVDGCVYDDATKKISAKEGKKCGMQSLLALVDAADTVRFEKGCEEALREYAQELCAPVNGDEHEYPWGCVRRAPSWIEERLVARAETACANDFASDYNMNSVLDDDGNVNEEASARNSKYGGKLDIKTEGLVSRIVDSIRRDMEPLLRDECFAIGKSKYEGYDDKDKYSELIFETTGYSLSLDDTINVSPDWTRNVFGNVSLQVLLNTGVSGYGLSLRGDTQAPDLSKEHSVGWGICMYPSARQLCTMQNQVPGMANTVEFVDGMCVLGQTWYEKKCQALGGYLSGDVCYYK